MVEADEVARTTSEAVTKFLDGDESAFSWIVRRWEGKVYSLAWRMLGSREDAQDVVQETFLSVFKAIRGLRDPGSFPTWLYQIALNHCRARRKSRASERQRSEYILDQTGPAGGILSNVPAVERGAEKLESIDIIRKALAGLGEDHRTAIVLKEYLGLSLEELASVMECPLSTAKSRLYNGLKGVQRNLKRMGIDLSKP
jgi:RNA polymerase sigma-70 factor (ECF subfamily)